MLSGNVVRDGIRRGETLITGRVDIHVRVFM